MHVLLPARRTTSAEILLVIQVAFLMAGYSHETAGTRPRVEADD
jgi:hypothetical protein